MVKIWDKRTREEEEEEKERERRGERLRSNERDWP